MTRLLGTPDSESAAVPVGAAAWTVAGSVFNHSAVKFWSGLLDEAAEDFPGSDGVVVEGPCDELLVPDLLDPTDLFQKEMESLDSEDAIDGTMEELAQELEAIGPPLPVRATVLAGAQVVCARDLPDEAIDSELLPLFLVWPLEWGGLSEFGWNRSRVSGRFEARDTARGLTYAVRFRLENRHLHEGLFHRKLTMRFQREPSTAAG